MPYKVCSKKDWWEPSAKAVRRGPAISRLGLCRWFSDTSSTPKKLTNNTQKQQSHANSAQEPQIKQTRTEQLSIKMEHHLSVLNNDRASTRGPSVTINPFARRPIDTRTYILHTPLVDSCNSPAPATVYTRHQISSTSRPSLGHIAGLGRSVLGCGNPKTRQAR